MSTVKYVFLSLVILVALQAANGCSGGRSLYMTDSAVTHSLVKDENNDNFDPLTISLDGIVPPGAAEVIVYVTAQSGWNYSPVDYTAAVIVSSVSNTKESPYSESLILHPYKEATTWSYNSDHLTLPVLSGRSIDVEVAPDANGQLKNVAVTVEVVAYRI